MMCMPSFSVARSREFPPLPANTHAFIGFAHELADIAGVAIRPYFGNPSTLGIETKKDDSPVSLADKAAEQAMRDLIRLTYPAHGIYGEEHGTHQLDARYVWVIDPIDGTRAFIQGKKEWGTLIALCEDGVPILGILDQPVTRERWIGHADIAELNRNSIRTRSRALKEAELSTTSRHYFTPPQASRFIALAEQVRHVVEDGDCYSYGLLACGERDVVVDAGLKPFDILALVPIITAAGGTITGWDGMPVTLTHSTNVVAAGDAALHQAALAVLNAGQ